MATIHRIPHSPPPGRPAKPRKARKSAGNRFTSNQAKAAYIAIGTLGLAALAVAILGPKRLERQVLTPLRKAVGPPAEKLWDQAKPVREQLTGLFQKAGAERHKLATDFQSWVGHFRDH